MKFTFLGTGTSHGIPVIGCNCKVCKSKDFRNKRNRCSAFVETDDKKILIDISPEFRFQALKIGLKQIDAVLLTHSHADHLHGIDDLRIFSASMFKIPDNPLSLKSYNAPPLPIFSNKITIDDIQSRFSYLFSEVFEGGGHAKLELKEATKPFFIGKTQIIPIPMMHGHLETVGWLLTEIKNGQKQSIAYLTDCNFISEDSIRIIKENCGILRHTIIDGLRIRKMTTHYCFLEAMEIANKLNSERVWFTHINHESSHKKIKKYISEHLSEFPNLQKKSVAPSYDFLELKI